jgi:hypothetical protein
MCIIWERWIDGDCISEIDVYYSPTMLRERAVLSLHFYSTGYGSLGIYLMFELGEFPTTLFL